MIFDAGSWIFSDPLKFPSGPIIMPSRLTTALLGIAILLGCAEQAPPAHTVTEFVENPILLEAALVRCSQDRRESRYDPECINAREAVNRIEAKEEEIRRVELEVRSEAKRRALRRTQEAQAEAHRRAEEAERLREERATSRGGRISRPIRRIAVRRRCGWRRRIARG
jgi:hypothetical protein